MRIILLTNKNQLAVEILNQLLEASIEISAILIEQPRPNTKTDQIKFYLKKCIPHFLINILRKIRKLQSVKKWENNKHYKTFPKQLFIVSDINDKVSESILNKLNPDLIILAGTGILRKNIIGIPKFGILNAHPGLLPKYRGVDVIPWSIYNDDPVGVTIHFIDEGVDTGKICKQETIEIKKNDTLESLRRKAEQASAIMLKNVVLEIMKENTIHTFPNKKEEGKQFYKMDLERIKEVEDKLKDN